MSLAATDETEQIRRELIHEVNSEPKERAALEAQYGRVWTLDELREEFAVLGFQAPYAVVRRRSDRQLGSVMFQHHPRYYFSFDPHLD